MPYLKRMGQLHRCFPPNARQGMKQAGVGSVWACPTCRQQFIIKDDQREGLYWERLPPEEWLPNPAAPAPKEENRV